MLEGGFIVNSIFFFFFWLLQLTEDFFPLRLTEVLKVQSSVQYIEVYRTILRYKRNVLEILEIQKLLERSKLLAFSHSSDSSSSLPN